MIVLEVLFLAVFWSWACSALLFLRNTVLPRSPITASPEHLHLPSRAIQFQATDGVLLEGWLIPREAEKPWIILCHGVGSNRADLLDIAAGLHRAGFNLLLFDFRGHGGSEGRTTSFGWREQRDLEGALVFLGRQEEVPEQPFGIYGISMGGAVALMVAAKDERIAAMAVDSPYASLEETLSQHLALLYPWLPKVPFLWFVLSTYRLRFGVWPGVVSPERSVTQLNGRPLLLIQGAQDLRMPLAGAKRLIDGASGPKEFWVVEDAGHLEAFSLDPKAYLKRLVGFFRTHLS